jgi:uncharacterized SAM-binding protein YcdF (DUF218 family)
MTEINTKILTAARSIWDYLKLDMPIQKSDGILIFCSNDLRVAEYAASLYHTGYGGWICPSGGIGRLTYDLFHKPEALAFSEVLQKLGVPEKAIHPEIRATNSAENTFFSRALIEKNNLPHAKLIALQKPYMERRTLATLTHYWPDQDFDISSPNIAFNDYPFPGFSNKDLIEVLAGEFQRIIVYAERGWQSPQPVPDEVNSSFKLLVASGYTGQLADPTALPSKPPTP